MTIIHMPGQTLSEIRSLLAAAGLAPQHRFGQNFLIDLNLMRKLVAAADLQPGDVVLEVGAGTGSLTEMLLDARVRVIAVEIDRGFQGLLRERLGEQARFTLVQGDALASKHRVNPLVLSVLRENPPEASGAYKLVANLPYQIATPLLIDLLLMSEPVGPAENAADRTLARRDRAVTVAPVRFDRLTCTIQKEVAERLTGEPRTNAYGPVSVLTQLLAEVVPHAIIPPTAFWPQPDVQSVLLTLQPRPRDDVNIEDLRGFAGFVQRAFQQRRKMLRRMFRDWDELELLGVFQQAGVSPNSRPEELSPPAWRALYAAVGRRSV